MKFRTLIPTLFFLPFLVVAQPTRVVADQVLALQARYAALPTVSLFTVEAATPETDALWRSACRTAEVLRFDEAAADRLIAEAPELLRLHIPYGDSALTLQLYRSRILADGFLVQRASDGARVTPPPAVHYRGLVENAPHSLVAISVFGDQLMGLIADDNGQRVIGPLEKAPRGFHVFYRERDLLGTNRFACSALNVPGAAPEHPHGNGEERSTRCVKWYWEAAYQIFQNKGGLINTVNYLTGVFNQSAILFANDGIDVVLQEIYVWDEPSPYNGGSSHERLYQFGDTRTSFNGDFAHLLDLASYGGVAYLNTACSLTRYRMAYSGINSSYSNVPTYSWTVNVVTHEQGHNLGSSHTHDCVWNGDQTAIDGCGPSKGYPGDGNCPQAEIPAGGGTIMSYCHLVSGVGINLNLGFGPQPRQVILNRVNSASCLAICGTTCDAPLTHGVLSLTQTGGTLYWTNSGAGSYDLRWKAVADPTWQQVNGLTVASYDLTGLQPGTAYEFQVMAQCGSGSSAWSQGYTFTTLDPCPDALEPNDTWQTAAIMDTPANIDALIASPTDQDHYAFTADDYSYVYLNLGGMAVDLDLYLLDATGAVWASSTETGTSSEYIYTSVVPGSYTVRVVGYEGAYSSVQCYHLVVVVNPNNCIPPFSLGSSAITGHDALIGWGSVPAATGYELRWKPSADDVWNTVQLPAVTSYTLTGLAAGTSYDVAVRSLCNGGPGGSQGGGSSEYSPTHTFITLGEGCPLLLQVKLLLEGPYQASEGLMADSLRSQEWIPLTEPYTAMGLPIDGQQATTAGVLATTGPNAIVDWVAVELRDAATGASVVERQAALLQRDGDVVALDGISPLGFCSNPGQYRVAVRHRNHLGCMTAQAVAFGSAQASVDFSSPDLATYGTEARKAVGSVRVLWSGNTNGDVQIKYAGQGNDRDPILTAIGGANPTQVVSGYLVTDVNMDGVAKYIGPANDRDPVLVNIGGSSPTEVRTEQLP